MLLVQQVSLPLEFVETVRGKFRNRPNIEQITSNIAEHTYDPSAFAGSILGFWQFAKLGAQVKKEIMKLWKFIGKLSLALIALLGIAKIRKIPVKIDVKQIFLCFITVGISAGLVELLQIAKFMLMELGRI